MSIRLKLITLVVGTLVLSAASLCLFLVFLAPVNRIERERGYLSALAEAMKEEQVQLNRLPYAGIKEGSRSFQAAVDGTDGAFVKLGDIRTLPRLNQGMKDSLEIIRRLKTLRDRNLAAMQADYQVLVGDAKAVFTFFDFKNFTEFSDYDFLNPVSKALASAALPHLHKFMTSQSIMQGSLEAALSTVADQYSIIDRQIRKSRSEAIAAAAGIAGLIVALSVTMALVLANGIAAAVIGLERNISLLKDGDLSGRAKIRSRDEMGKLSADLNRFLDGLSGALNRIKGISGTNVEMKDELLKAVTEASGSVAQIQVSTESMGKQIRGFDRSIEESTRSIGRILRGIEELDEQIEGQGSMVEEVTASVTEMLSSLDSMGRITERDRALAEGLVRVAERGHRVIEEASDKIAEIPRSVGIIREMAEVIRGVAASTDLLAMNAAIEAAHAGEAGRGFAVVADEIRKLSEASGASSDDIARSIESIIARIEEAMGANAGTSEAFAAIDGKIREVASSMDELFSGLGEIRQGSEQILQAMTVLQERSMRVKEGSSSMKEASSEIGAMTEELGRVSSEVSTSIGEIGDGMSDIDRAIDTVAKLAERVGDGSNRLDEDVGRFKTA